MRFEDKQLETSFSIPDKLTVRQVLRYRSAVEMSSEEATLYERLWTGLIQVAQGWESAHISLTENALDEAANPQAVDVIRWAGTQAFTQVMGLDAQEDIKNS